MSDISRMLKEQHEANEEAFQRDRRMMLWFIFGIVAFLGSYLYVQVTQPHPKADKLTPSVTTIYKGDQ